MVDPNGHRQQLSKGGFKSLREADNARSAALHAIETGSYVRSERVTLGQFLLEEWLPSRLPPVLEESTWHSYDRYLRLHVVSRLGSVAFQRLTPMALNRLYRDRPTPYLWSQADVCRLLEEARRLLPPLRGVTHEALFGLLATSGMRVGEALALKREEVDLQEGVITIHQAKFDRSRLVPLHRSATAALGRYAAERERLCPRPRSDAFFLSSTGASLHRSDVGKTLRKITTATGIRTVTSHPRAHDLRHSLAVHTIIEWQRSGVSVDERIGGLSTYLGHLSPADTYWYLSASPELMELAASRLEARFGVDIVSMKGSYVAPLMVRHVAPGFATLVRSTSDD